MWCAFSLLAFGFDIISHTATAMSSSKSYISCQYVTGVQQCCAGGRLPLCIKDTRSFWRQSFSCTNHFFSRYYRKLQCVDISLCCSCGRRESGNNQRPALLRGPLILLSDGNIWLKRNCECQSVGCAADSTLRRVWGPAAGNRHKHCVLSHVHTHTYIHSQIYKHTNTHVYLYAHTCKHCYKTTTHKILCALTETQNTLKQLSEKKHLT